MASLENVKAVIRDIASRPKNVAFSEIEGVVKQLAQFYDVRSRSARHGTLFNVEGHPFMVCSHNPGSKQVKRCYVDGFIDVMIDLGLYEE